MRDRHARVIAYISAQMSAADPPGADCEYCSGYRCPCTCAEDCGARASDNGHVCPKAPADVRAGWLRATGLYSEHEIKRLTDDTA